MRLMRFECWRVLVEVFRYKYLVDKETVIIRLFFTLTPVSFLLTLTPHNPNDSPGLRRQCAALSLLSVGTKVATASTEQSMATDSNRFFEKVYEGTSAALLQ